MNLKDKLFLNGVGLVLAGLTAILFPAFVVYVASLAMGVGVLLIVLWVVKEGKK